MNREYLISQLQIHMRSSHGEIEVFLCPDDPGTRTVHSPATVTTQQTSHQTQPITPVAPKSSATSLPPELLVNSGVNNRMKTPPSIHTHAKVDHTSVKLERLDDTMSLLSGSTGMRDALLCESDDYGPMGGGRFQLQTEDQNSSSGETTKVIFQSSFIVGIPGGA